MMRYYRHKETGDVFAYTQEDLDRVDKLESDGPEVDQSTVILTIRDNLEECNEMTAQEVAEHLAPLPPAAPAWITARQARLWLAKNGKLAQVEAALADIPGPEGDMARIEWEHAGTIEREHPLLPMLEGLGIDIDLAMLEASTL